MNELIRIQTNENGQAVSARELHEKLGIAKHFTQWWDNQINMLNLIEGKDFLTLRLESTGGRPSVDYIIPLDIAKHLAMMSGGENAHKLREYFIQVEKKWNSPEAVMSRALQFANQKMQNLLSDIEIMKPKAEAYDTFMNGSNLQTMNDVAKCLGMGRNKLFAFLRDKKILRANNTPYQEYCDRGYFEVKEKPIKMGDAVANMLQTFVTARGVDYISRLIKA